VKGETINYDELYVETKGLLDHTVPLHTNLGNFAALLKYKSNWFWVGFYEVVGQQLILNVFQGPPACVKIPYGKGVCGKSWELRTSIIVDNVHEFEGHIACNEASKSEIVIPIFDSEKNVRFILDVDHHTYNAFSKSDKIGIKKSISLIETLL
tara:strand:+ start:285 stop:743 length:459 start_codon:yes stop_codon:yes gene_type:complete